MAYQSNNQDKVRSDSSDSTSSTITSYSTHSFEALGHSIGSNLKVRTLEESVAMNDLKRKNSSRHVSFDSVNIHEHAVILGCNPGIRALSSGPGPAFTLAWENLRTSNYNLDDFEAERQLSRRPKSALRKTKEERVNYLREQGFSCEEIKLAEEGIRKIHESREQSAHEKSDLQALLNDSKKRQQEKRRKRKGKIVDKLFRVFSTKT